MQAFVLTLRATALLALTLSGCGSSDSALGEQPTLTGQIEGWNQGTGFTLQGLAFKLGGDSKGEILTTASVDGAGNFRIVLPSSTTMTPFLQDHETASDAPLPPQCTGGVQFNPTFISIAELQLKVVKEPTAITLRQGNGDSAIPTGDNFITAVYTYSARAYTEIGSVTCTGGATEASNGESTVDLHMQVGWNRVLQGVARPKSNVVNTSATTGAVPADVKWRLIR